MWGVIDESSDNPLAELWGLFKSDDDVFDTLERFLSDDEFYRLPDVESECRKIYDALPWKKAIIVYIETR